LDELDELIGQVVGFCCGTSDAGSLRGTIVGIIVELRVVRVGELVITPTDGLIEVPTGVLVAVGKSVQLAGR